MTLGNFIERERTLRGLSQAELAKIASVGKATISETETGAHTPRLNTLVKVLTALNNTK